MSGHCYFEIQADDIQRAITFYGALFGWRFERIEGLPVEYWRIDSGGTGGGLLQRPARTPPAECGTNAFVCSFEVVDFDDSARHIVSAGGQVALPRFAVPRRCWQGYFLDTESNTFGIFQADSAAS